MLHNSWAQASCEYDYCVELAGNGKCDQKCNNQQCQFDGGDCALGQLNPWENCPPELECAELYNDGMCDPKCNTQECLYDGFDCMEGSG